MDWLTDSRTLVERWATRPARAPALAAAALATFAMGLAGCGSSGSDPATPPPPPPAAQTGDVFIAITDAEGDFVNYSVDVVSLLLERANGDQVETLPLTTRIDFTELTEVTEFLTIATVPAGAYQSVVFTLDFQNADIVVQDADGNELAASAIDANGDPLGLFDMRLNLGNTDVIRIAPGVPAAFSLDFDLDASNSIDLSGATPVVIVEPFLLAKAELEEDREHRVRGALAAVDETNSEFTLRVRPFRHRTGNFGRFTVEVDEDTQYEVDGSGYTGGAGLAAMAALAQNTPVLASGSIRGRQMQADIVLAGSSIPWTDGPVVRGIVTARVDNALTVRGARVEFANGVEVFRGEGTILLGEGTTVTAPGVDNANLSIASVSVGQRIIAFGELLDDRTLDASNGRIAMRMNQLTAEVVDANPLAVDLYFLNGRRPAVFDFSGTGVEASMDADPDYYQIDTGSLNLNNLASGDLVRVRGLINDFGAAPDDYNARTVIDVDTESRPGSLTIAWLEGSLMPFHSLSETMLDVDLSESREFLKFRGVPRNMSNPLESALLVAPDDGRGLYAVKVRGAGELHLFRNFADLTAELDAQLDGGAKLHRITAHVRYTDDGNGFITRRASFIFAAPGE